MSDYLLDKDFTVPKNRLVIKESIQDPATLEYLEKIKIKKGWHCLELGGGAGSVTAWLCEKVGVKGKVTVIDLDIRFLDRLSYENLEIIKQNISDYDFGTEKYNLVHGRDILMHIENRNEILEKISNAVKSNGWILLEEPDVSIDTPDPLVPEYEKKLYEKVTSNIYLYLQRKGIDPYYGATLPGRLRNIGFTSLMAEGRVQMYTGGINQQKTPHIMAFEQLEDALISDGFLLKSEFTDFLKLFEDDNFAWKEGFTMSVWGKKLKSKI
jgi:SAM-dependent methyltransferase